MRIFLNSPTRSEIELLRKENQILKRKLGRKLKFSNLDRAFMIAMHRVLPQLVAKLTIVQPKTVIEWHRKLVSKKWNYSSRRQGRPPIESELKNLIWDMKRSNQRWGAGKIVGALKKLGIKIGRETVRSILREGGFYPSTKDYGPTSLEFLRSQCNRWWACDFFVVDTAFLNRIYVFFIIDCDSREIVGWACTRNPTAEWLTNVVRSAFMGRDDYPEYFISDRDGIFGEWFGEFLAECYHIRHYRTPPRTPNCNAHAERMVLTFREESLDHCIVYNENDLRRILLIFIDYYNNCRSHMGIDYDAPLTKLKKPRGKAIPKYVKKKILGGLITDYANAA